MTAILGISAHYHDSAAALVIDGQVVAAAEEERFSRRKHDESFPFRAIDYCLQHGGLTPERLDYVAFYEKPLLRFGRLLETYLAFAPAGFPSFAKAVPLWIHEKLHVRRQIRRALGSRFRKRCVFAEHHQSHAASAFFPSPFHEAAVLTFDAVGEWATAAFGTGQGNTLRLHGELHFPHSLGLLYSAFTYFCGFRVNSGEYKLMGLAPYGRPRYVPLILERLLDLKPDGSFRLNLEYFNYCQGLTMTSRRFELLFGSRPRKPGTPITEREMDLAASIQQVTEQVVLRAARHVHEQTGMKDLCLAGGVALNCVANGRLLREGPFERVWIQPAAGDAGAALGAAMLVWYQLLDQPRDPVPGDAQQGSLLGPQFSDEQVEQFLRAQGGAYHRVADDETLCRRVAEHLAAGKVVGWLQGRMEFGPRALGARSILADPRRAEMQSLLNGKVKFRESFRPFAPAVLAEYASEYFDLPCGVESPYMLLAVPLREDKRMPVSMSRTKQFEEPAQPRSVIPAVTHVDYSARLQTVDAARHGRFWRLLREFNRLTGCPVLINTSFNVRGQPIVCSPADAYGCFVATGMDILVMEHFVLYKEEQPRANDHPADEYLAKFPLD